MAHPIEFHLPDLDLAGASVVASAWHASVGQKVLEGDRLIEVTAGDVTVDLTAPASGILLERCVKIDDPLQTGQVLARIQPQ
jgi:pyruvate/2-oxoglutarate dehydrogenase complex dihydrolipoamide acyltransferase (E2) component